MFEKIKNTVQSREFQSIVGQTGIAVVSIIASSVVAGLVSKTLNTQLENLLNKIHIVEELPTK